MTSAKPLRSVFALSACFSLSVLSACATSARKAPEEKVSTAPAVLPSGPLADLGAKLSWEDHRLPNGLRVLLVQDPKTPVVAYQSWYGVGSVDEKPGATGLAHLFEHLMFKGTPRFPSGAFFRELEARGAEVNAFTTRDYTVYHQTFTPELLPKVIEMEADRMRNLVLTPEVVTTEKQVVLEERRLRVDNSPDGKMQEALWALSFRRHPYQWPVIGTPEDVIQVPIETVIDFYRAYYQPGNLTLVVSGNIDPVETLAMIRAQYGAIEGRRPARRSFPTEPGGTGERRLVIRDAVASPKLLWSFRTTAASDPDTYALDVLATILFDGTSSRGYRRLVDELDWVSRLSGVNFTPTFPGLFTVSATMKGNLPAEMAEKELERLVRSVQAEGVTEKELERAKRLLTVELVQSIRSAEGIANLLGTVTLILGDPSGFEDDLSKYARVTAEQVQAVARKYLVPNSRTVITLLPQGATEAAK